jgi:hypothetical protein
MQLSNSQRGVQRSARRAQEAAVAARVGVPSTSARPAAPAVARSRPASTAAPAQHAGARRRVVPVAAAGPNAFQQLRSGDTACIKASGCLLGGELEQNLPAVATCSAAVGVHLLWLHQGHCCCCAAVAGAQGAVAPNTSLTRAPTHAASDQRPDTPCRAAQVFGVGGGGSNAVNTMVKAWQGGGIEFWIANTDAQVRGMLTLRAHVDLDRPGFTRPRPPL